MPVGAMQIWRLLHPFCSSFCISNFVAESTFPVASRSLTHAQHVEIDQFAVFGSNSQLLQQPLDEALEPSR